MAYELEEAESVRMRKKFWIVSFFFHGCECGMECGNLIGGNVVLLMVFGC